MTFMSYPTLPGVVPLDNLVEQSYWDVRQTWYTQIAWYQWGMMAINLVILSVGLGAMIVKWKWNGFTPLVIFLAYHASNALARTSGGRYLVPVDWALHLYYFLGLVSIILFLTKGTLPAASELKENSKGKKPKRRENVVLIVLVFVFGLVGSLPVIVGVFPDRLPVYSNQEAADLLGNADLSQISDTGYQFSDVESFLLEGDGDVITGLSLYPRYYLQGESDVESAYVPEMPDEFDRIYFVLLADQKEFHVNLLQNVQRFRGFPNAKQLMVIGCNQKLYFDAYFVVDIEEGKLISIRTPGADLVCEKKK
jgi:hypothetical protein